MVFAHQRASPYDNNPAGPSMPTPPVARRFQPLPNWQAGTGPQADGAVRRRAASTSGNQIGEWSSEVPTYEKPAGAESIICAKKEGQLA